MLKEHTGHSHWSREHTGHSHWSLDVVRQEMARVNIKILGISEPKSIYFFFTLKPLTVWSITNCRKLFKRWEYHTILTVSYNLYAHQEATVRTLGGKTDWFKIEKGV